MDDWMVVRVMAYVALLWQDLIKARMVKPGEPLPPVLPIVLYNGAAPWDASTSLRDLQAPDLPMQLQHWQPQMRYLLLEERAYDRAHLAVLRNLVAALFRLEQSRTPADIEQVVAALIEWLGEPAQDSLRRAFAAWLKRVLLPTHAPDVTVPNVTDLQELHAMLAERVKTWPAQWKAEGLEQGRQQGQRQLLRRQLHLRFGILPAWVDDRLEQADDAALELWAERVLTCAGLDEVFQVPG